MPRPDEENTHKTSNFKTLASRVNAHTVLTAACDITWGAYLPISIVKRLAILLGGISRESANATAIASAVFPILSLIASLDKTLVTQDGKKCSLSKVYGNSRKVISAAKNGANVFDLVETLILAKPGRNWVNPDKFGSSSSIGALSLSALYIALVTCRLTVFPQSSKAVSVAEDIGDQSAPNDSSLERRHSAPPPRKTCGDRTHTILALAAIDAIIDGAYIANNLGLLAELLGSSMSSSPAIYATLTLGSVALSVTGRTVEMRKELYPTQYAKDSRHSLPRLAQDAADLGWQSLRSCLNSTKNTAQVLVFAHGIFNMSADAPLFNFTDAVEQVADTMDDGVGSYVLWALATSILMGLIQAGMTYINYDRKANKLPDTDAPTPAPSPVSVSPRGDIDLENQLGENDLSTQLLDVVGSDGTASDADNAEEKQRPYSPPPM